MPFSIRPFRRFPVQCPVSYNAGPFKGQGTVWNLSCWGLTRFIQKGTHDTPQGGESIWAS